MRMRRLRLMCVVRFGWTGGNRRLWSFRCVEGPFFLCVSVPPSRKDPSGGPSGQVVSGEVEADFSSFFLFRCFSQRFSFFNLASHLSGWNHCADTVRQNNNEKNKKQKTNGPSSGELTRAVRKRLTALMENNRTVASVLGGGGVFSPPVFCLDVRWTLGFFCVVSACVCACFASPMCVVFSLPFFHQHQRHGGRCGHWACWGGWEGTEWRPLLPCGGFGGVGICVVPGHF